MIEFIERLTLYVTEAAVNKQNIHTLHIHVLEYFFYFDPFPYDCFSPQLVILIRS